MIILGIDPGTANTGYGVIKETKAKKPKTKAFFQCLDYGVIKTFPSSTAPKRLQTINSELNKLIKKHNPEVLAMESLFFCRNLKTAIPVSQAGGVILFTAAKKNIPVHEFTPLQVKLVVSGFGWSEKKVVHQKLKKLLKLKEIPKSDDAADALAIALAFCLKKAK